MKTLAKKILARLGYRVCRIQNQDDTYPILRPIAPDKVEILADSGFQSSCRMIAGTTLLDTPRLANLWALCRLTDPAGAMAEIGVFRGGGSLHLSNCCPQRTIVLCDPFSDKSFEELDPELDKSFYQGQFQDHRESDVRGLLANRNAIFIKGYFPGSVAGKELPSLSFVHLDVDVYLAMKQSLLFLLSEDRLLPKSLIVLDDFNREAAGVNTAVAEIQAAVEGTLAFPMFPGQALIVPKSWYQES